MAPDGLAALLAALREAGHAVGSTEVLRLREVFNREPDLPSRERLGSLLRAVLVKSADDRARFGRLFDLWYQRTDEEWQQPAEKGLEARPWTARAGPRRGHRRFSWPLAAGWILLLCAGLFFQERPPLTPKKGPEATTSPPTTVDAGGMVHPPARESLTADQVRQKTFEAWIPTFTVTQAPWPGWGPLGLAALALAATVGFWFWQRRRPPDFWVPAPAPPPPVQGPPRRFLPPAALSGPQLLGRSEQEAMVWGIDHFTTDEPTRRLDLAATVRATVRAGGIPRLVFRQARHPREVWLWVDETADDPTLARVADEIEEALRAHGLPVERAAFRGVPQQLITAAGELFAPSELDERRDTARVAVLTDGRQLVRQATSDRRRVALDALLRQLSHWPRLAFVDFSRGASGLALLLAPHGLPRIAPEELAGFLGGSRERARVQAAKGEVDAWAAACALSPAPVAEETALALRRRLFPRVSPWHLATLRAAAAGPAGRLWWRPDDRVERLNQLSAAERQGKEALAAKSRLGRALTFWEERYGGALQEGDETDLPATPAERRWLAERLFLQLWRDPGPVVRRLHRLYRGGLEQPIREALELHTAADADDGERIRLPWIWTRRPAAERVLLAEMGFGGGLLPLPSLGRPGRVWLVLGLGLGLAAGGLAAAYLRTLRAGDEPPVIVRDADWPAEAQLEVVPAADGPTPLWAVIATTGNLRAVRWAAGSSEVRARWRQRRRRCVENQLNGVEIWRCGRWASPVHESRFPELQVVLVGTKPGAGTEALALDLLDSGSAQTVIIDTGRGLRSRQFDFYRFFATLSGWRGDPRQQSLALWFAGSAGAAEIAALVGDRQVWLKATPDPARLAAQLRFDGQRKLSGVWPDLQKIVGDPDWITLRGLGTGPCRPGEILQENGFNFVRICGGTFTKMGSRDEQPFAQDSEKPTHRVTVGEFWMAQTEITWRQYQGVRSEKADLPATGLNWHEALEFCARFGYRLPTEVEWEYAERAGTTAPNRWRFEDSGKYAWSLQNSGLKVHAVGQKLPNPWGLYDMQGNVWEWVADKYDESPQVFPTGPSRGIRRVVRGGSFVNSYWQMHAMSRNWYPPELRDGKIGFRCVRSPRRQL